MKGTVLKPLFNNITTCNCITSEYCEIFKNTFFTEQLPTTASDILSYLKCLTFNLQGVMVKALVLVARVKNQLIDSLIHMERLVSFVSSNFCVSWKSSEIFSGRSSWSKFSLHKKVTFSFSHFFRDSNMKQV